MPDSTTSVSTQDRFPSAQDTRHSAQTTLQSTIHSLLPHIQGKKVLFITTKNIDYIRNSQELKLLQEQGADLSVIGDIGRTYLTRLLRVYGRLLFSSFKGFDTIFVGFAPQLIFPFIGGKLEKAFVIQDFFISLYDTFCLDRKRFRPNSLLGRLLHKLDAYTLQKGDLILTDTKAHGDYFHQEFGAKPEKLQTLYLEADTRIYYPRQSSRPDYLKDRYVVLYFGSVLPLQGIDVILGAVELLKDRADLAFVLIGPMSNSALPQGENIHYLNWLPQEELAVMISYADLCLAGHFHGSIEKARRTIPGKAYIYEAMKKPMVLGDSPANHELFTADQNHYFVPMGDAQALADAIMHCKQEATEQPRAKLSKQTL